MRLDPVLHSVARQTPPSGDARTRDSPLLDPSGGGSQPGDQYPESRAERAGVSGQSGLDRPLGDITEVVRAKKPQRLPVVLTRDEVRQLDGIHWLAVCLRNVTFSMYTSPSEPIWTEPTEGYADIAVRPAAKALSTDRRDADGTAPRGCGRRV